MSLAMLSTANLRVKAFCAAACLLLGSSNMYQFLRSSEATLQELGSVDFGRDGLSLGQRVAAAPVFLVGGALYGGAAGAELVKNALSDNNGSGIRHPDTLLLKATTDGMPQALKEFVQTAYAVTTLPGATAGGAAAGAFHGISVTATGHPIRVSSAHPHP